jgi:cytochrome c oxidase subunit III
MPAPSTLEIADSSGSGGGVPALPPRDDGWSGDSRPAHGPPQGLGVTGVVIALAGVLMFFAALVSAYVVRQGLGGLDWRPFEFPRILWLNTLILLSSSFTIVRARRHLRVDDRKGFRHWWVVTAVLGLFFVAGQLIAWRQLAAAGVYLEDNPASSFFYLFTAAHGIHLLGGIAALVAIACRSPLSETLAKRTEAASIYWHFMDGMWLFLFFFLLFGYRR